MNYKYYSPLKTIKIIFELRAKFKEMLFNPLTNNFNYTTRIPEYSLIPLASNNNELAKTLLSKALTNFNTVNVNSKSVSKQDLVDEVNNLTSKDNNQEYKGTFIENFPLNKEHALNFDKKTDGINLFVNINFVNYDKINQNNVSEYDANLFNKDNFKNNKLNEDVNKYYNDTDVLLNFNVDLSTDDLSTISNKLQKEIIKKIRI